LKNGKITAMFLMPRTGSLYLKVRILGRARSTGDQKYWGPELLGARIAGTKIAEHKNALGENTYVQDTPH